MKFRVLEIVFNDREMIMINGLGWEKAGNENIRIWLSNAARRGADPLNEFCAKGFASLIWASYEHVANVEAPDLEGVFAAMNCWSPDDEAAVDRLAPLHSLSIGDIVVDENMVAWVVNPCGFARLNAPVPPVIAKGFALSDSAKPLPKHEGAEEPF